MFWAEGIALARSIKASGEREGSGGERRGQFRQDRRGSGVEYGLYPKNNGEF